MSRDSQLLSPWDHDLSSLVYHVNSSISLDVASTNSLINGGTFNIVVTVSLVCCNTIRTDVVCDIKNWIGDSRQILIKAG